MSNKLNKLYTVAFFIGLYFCSTGISFAVFNYLKKPPELEKPTTPTPEEGGLLIDISGPKTEECPLTGLMYTENEKDVWSERRPLTVMIENHQEARPQSGFTSADVVYEAVAEGGITRMLSIFYCDAVKREVIIGPVRSARTYFLDFASEYGETPLYAHVGGAHCDGNTGEGCLNGAKADALGQIADYGWERENDLNQFSIGYPTFWRDYERLGHTVATEHTMYSTTERLWAVGKKRGWTNENPDGENWSSVFTPWTFQEQAEEADRGDTAKISFIFWENKSDYDVAWEYDKTANVYKRTNGGQPHKDLNNDEQISYQNVVVQFMEESPANDGYPGNVHLLYETIGEGEALVFNNGQATEAKWVKSSRKSRTKFFDSKGKEIPFVAGKIWIEILPTGNEVEY